jgi:hypothetical protein
MAFSLKILLNFDITADFKRAGEFCPQYQILAK